MKKSLLVCTLLIFAQMVFAGSVKLKASGDGADIVERNNEIFQTKYTASDIGVTVGAKVVNSNLRYDLEIINNSDKDIYFDTNYIRVFQGDYNDGKWYSMRYKNSGYPVTSNQEEEEDTGLTLAEGIAAGVVVATVAVGAFLLFNWLRDADDPIDWDIPHRDPPSRPSRPHHKDPPPHTTTIEVHHHDVIDDILFYQFIDSLDDDDYELNVKGFDTLNSGNISRNKSLYGSFYIDEGIGPDYKIEIAIPGEETISFVFKGKQTGVRHTPSEYGVKRNEKQQKFVTAVGGNVLETGGGSLYLMYLGNPMGAYFSTGFRLAHKSGPVVGYVENHDLNHIIFENYGPGEFSPNGSFESDAFNLSAGFTSKLCPYVWVLGGCGVDFTYRYINGYLNDGKNTYNNVYIEDKEPTFVVKPQIGLNFSYGIWDFGTMFKYPLNGKPELDLIFGIAF